MKKNILFLLLIISSISNAKITKGKNRTHVLLKSNVEVETKFKKNNKQFTKLKYRPIDFTLTTNNDKLKFNFVLQGSRQNIFKPDFAIRYDTIKLNKSPEVKIIKEKDFFGDEIISEEYYGNKFTYTDKKDEFTTDPRYLQIALSQHVEKALFDTLNKNNNIHVHDHDHGDHSHHNHDHSHEHSDDDDDHDHLHEHNREHLDLFTPKLKKITKESNDAQLKTSLEYFNGFNGFKWTQYLTSFKEEDRKHFAGESIIEGKNINLFNDNISLSFVPRFYFNAYKLKPLLTELDLDLRYKKDENTTLGIYAYNGLQLQAINEKDKYKNKVEFFYDYNTEKHRQHKFYEILNHEHDKEDQIKVKLGLTHVGDYEKHLFTVPDLKNKYKRKDEKFTTELELKLKKTNIFTDNLVLENNLNIKHNYEQTQDSKKVYINFFEYKFENEEDKYLKNDPDFLSDSSKIKEFLYKNDDGFELHTVYEKKINDPLLGNERTIKYMKIIKSKLLDDSGLENAKTTIHNIELENKTKAKYKYKGFNFNLKNTLKTKSLVGKNNTLINNKLETSVDRDLFKNFNLKLKLNNEYNTILKNNTYNHQTNLLGLGFDASYTHTFDDLRVKTGFDFTFSIQNRIAKKEFLLASKHPDLLEKTLTREEYEEKFPNSKYEDYLEIKEYTKELADSLRKQLQEENNKWVYGHEIDLKPYIELKAKIIKGLYLTIKGEANIQFKRDNFLRLYNDFVPKADKTTYSGTDTKFTLNLQYRY
ncbi:hypothetical protein [Oceanivirga salmonicida]|uniref:hypothetical protein n=1 Tax=Oceanivirga salmonicida TaxID=1769291 RepID=UPI0008368198|nr:hypothetical protein [Oceanivirga salmonicida]